MNTTAAAEGATHSARYIDKALDVARAMVTAPHGGHRWTVLEVRPDGLILGKRAFGSNLRRYVRASSKGAL
jgi:hypothetical protein